jgi:hypothetical protein
MAYDPRLGYDPAQNAPRTGGVQTQEQWVADVAASMTLEFLNADGSRATSPLMAATLWQRAGIPLPPQEYIGILARNPNAAVPPIVYNSMAAMAQWLAANPQEAAAAGLTPPPPPGGPVLSPSDQERIFRAEENQRERDFQAGEAQRERDFQAGEAQRERDFRAAEAQRQREFEAQQAALSRAEAARQFDLRFAEDRRQFNATFLRQLLATAVELSRAPVDWLAYQYFMENISIPMTALNAASMARLLGAVPPTGPSEIGPMRGGPAAIDGDTSLMQAAGVSGPVLVSVAEATQQNPGSVPGISAADMFQKFMTQGINLDGLLEQARQEVARFLPGLASYIDQARARIPTGPFGRPVETPREIAPGAPPTGVEADRYRQAAASMRAQTTGSGDGATGVFTGPPAQPQPGATGTGAQNPQGEAMLAAIAAETGIPIQTLRQVVPVNLLAGGYSREAIINSPAVQSVLTGRQSALFRTAPVGDSKFGQIQAFGIPFNLRGGQDFQLDQFLKANPDQQQMQIGVIRATGQSLPDFFKQAERTAPIGPYASGAFGRRRF